MRRRVDAGRRSTRRGVQVIVLVTIGVAALLIVFNRSYVAPYGSPVGQVVLAGIACIFGFAFWWLRRLSEFQEPARFLLGAGDALTATDGPRAAVPQPRTARSLR